MVEQGDIIKINSFSQLALVVSKDTYNHTGMAIICPILNHPTTSTFEVEVVVDDTIMYVESDSLRQLDLKSRAYTKKGRLQYNKLIYVIDMAQSVIDYY